MTAAPGPAPAAATPPGPPVRLALTISGAVSLGAFEGGALAALLAGIQPHCSDPDGRIRVDVVAGASAGAITGLLAARVLQAGLDPVHVMREAWVVRPSLARLRATTLASPLSLDGMRELARDLIAAPPVTAPQPGEIRLTLALAALEGLSYRIVDLDGRRAIDATTHLDWAAYTVRPEWTVDDWLAPPDGSPVDAALASGANALAFGPRRLDRSRDRETYRANGVGNFPDDGRLWYTDGGTIENEPLGRALDLAHEVDGDRTDVRRVHLLVYPHPSVPDAQSRWRLAATPPFTATAVRAFTILTAQTVYDALQRLVLRNSRRRWLHDALAGLDATLDDRQWRVLADALRLVDLRIEIDRTVARELRATGAEPADAVDAVEARLHRDLHALQEATGPTHAGGGGTWQEPATAPTRADDRETVRRVLARLAGVGGAPAPDEVDVISPLEVPEAATTPVDRLLAGEGLSRFAGFLDERFRASDFALGYWAALHWMERRLTAHGLDPALAADVRRRAETAPGAPGAADYRQAAGLRLTWRGYAGLGGHAARTAAVVARDLLGRRRR